MYICFFLKTENKGPKAHIAYLNDFRLLFPMAIQLKRSKSMFYISLQQPSTFFFPRNLAETIQNHINTSLFFWILSLTQLKEQQKHAVKVNRRILLSK